MKTYSSLPGRERLLPVSCNLCSSSETEPAWECSGFSFVRCRGCGVYYQNPQPIQDELLDRYDDQYFSYEVENEEPFFRLQLLGLNDVRFDRLFPDPHGKSFLDIGCATGLLLDHQRRQGWDVRGVEICRPSAQYGIDERKLDIFVGTLENARFPDSSFDVVHFSHLIEHLNKPQDFLTEVARVVKPSGWVFVTTPNTDGFQARYFQASWRSAIADHLYLFSKKTLSSALRRAGFVPRSVKTWGGFAKGVKPQWIKPFLDRVVKWTGDGDVVLIAAQKAT